jgi:hypothetical protein
MCVCVFLVAYCCCCFFFFFTAAFKDDNNTSLLFSSFQGISIMGILPMGCCCIFFFFTATFKDNNKTSSLLFSSLLFISRDFHYGYSSHGTNSQNKMHKGLKQIFICEKYDTNKVKKIVDQIWQATQ